MTNKNYTISEFQELLETAISYSYTNYQGSQTRLIDIDEDPYTLQSSEEFYYDLDDYTLNLKDGTVIIVHQDENSLAHDGAEIGIIFEYGEQIFRYIGSFSSHDSNYWEDLIEVDKEIRMVAKVFYHAKRMTKK